MNFLFLKLNMSFLNQLIFHRYDWTIQEFADLMDFSRSTVYQILNQERPPSLAFILALYHVLDLSIADHLRLFHSVPELHAEALGKIIETYLRANNLLK